MQHMQQVIREIKENETGRDNDQSLLMKIDIVYLSLTKIMLELFFYQTGCC